MSQLFSKTVGEGSPLLLIHGWGMNHRVWEPIQDKLASQFRVTLVDLPGHGYSHALTAATMPEVLEHLVPLLSEQTLLLGWSLGGLIAQELARQAPDNVKSLIMVGSNPCFMQRDDWQHGLQPDVLQGFADNLQADYQATVKRFFALQFMGTRSDPARLMKLRKGIMELSASPSALASGLDLLEQTDVRHSLASQPTLWVLGRLDKLVPVSLAGVLSQFGTQHQVHTMTHAAHVPFVTHTEEFLDIVLSFSHE